MPHPIIYMDHSEIRRGRLEELKLAISEFVEVIKAHEPQLLAYDVYFNDDATQMTVVHVHRDSDSLELHLKVAGPALAKFVELIELQSMDLYGRPSADLMELLRKKARLLGTGTVRVHVFHAGFDRFEGH